MSNKNKEVKACFTVSVNGVPFINTDTVENAASMALGLHKMSNLRHSITVTDGNGSAVVILKSA